MSLPTTIQLSNTFGQWINATNDIVTTVGNTSHYILVSQNATPSVSTGNISVNGVMTLLTLAATGAVTVGTTLGVTGAATLSNTLAVTGATTLAAVSATTGTFSGAVTGTTYNDQTINATASLTGTLAVTGATTLAAVSATTGTFSGAVTGTTYNGQTINATASLTGTLAVASTVTGGTYNGQTISSAASFTGTMTVSGAISSSTSVALTGTTNDVGTITTGVWNAGAVTSSGKFTTTVAGEGFKATGVTTGASFATLNNSNTTLFVGLNDAAGTAIPFSGATASAAVFGTDGNFGLDFAANNTVRMKLSNAGLLTVSGFGYHTFGTGGTASSNYYAAIKLNGSSGTSGGAGTVLQANSVDQGYFSTYNLVFGGTTTHPIIWSSVAGGLDLFAAHASGAIRFYSGGTTLRMNLSAAGSLSVGATGGDDVRLSSVGSSTVAAGLFNDASGGSGSETLILMQRAGITVGSISVTNSGTTYGVSSDARLKIDRGVVTHTDVLRRTTVRDFDLIVGGARTRGVFAQEAYQIAPFAVAVGTDEIKDGHLAKPWQVDYSKYVPDLIVGWQQHDATITQLAARIAALESQDN